MTSFSKIIHEIESEIQAEYVAEAIAWADRVKDFAWSKAIHRFELALKAAIERQDYYLAKVEGEHYKISVLKLLKEFKTTKNLNEADSFLGAIRAG